MGYVFDAKMDDDVIVKLALKAPDQNLKVEYHKIPLRQLKERLSSLIFKRTFLLKSFKENNEIIVRRISKSNFQDTDCFNFSYFVTTRNEQNVEQTEFFLERIKTFVWIETEMPPSVSGTQEAIRAPLTETGGRQFNLLEKYLKISSEFCINSNKIYAPFTSFIQSSGFGKSKLCLDLLEQHPGIYMVFRRSTDTGIPKMLPWMEKFADYVGKARIMDFPTDFEVFADEYVSGRFLIALLACIREYKIKFIEKFELEKNNIVEALNESSKQQALIKLRALNESDYQKDLNNFCNLNELSFEEQALKNDIEEKLEAEKKLIMEQLDNEKIFNLKIASEKSFNLTVKTIGAMFKQKPSDINFNLNFENHHRQKISTLTVDINAEISSFFSMFDSIIGAHKFPFVIFLDEADVFNEVCKSERAGRLDPVNIFRRGLHLLDHTTRLMVMVVGTNSDALDFSPAVRDNSLRYINRRNLLPPLILSGNWDIFSLETDIDYTRLNFSRDVLCDKAMFNILVSFGRALWSSCLLNDVISIAIAKLQNGGVDSLGARLALLLVRANFTVNAHHILARNLIKSFMVIVSYASIDAKELKIGYSSEPVLAMASRRLLSDKKVRESCFIAIKEFLEKQAIDKGRIVETIFEHLLLFTVDDSERVHEMNYSVGQENSAFDSVRPLVNRTTHLLDESNRVSETNTTTEGSSDYHVTTVEAFLKKFTKANHYSSVAKMIDDDVLKGFINCSHFVQMEKLSEDDFSGISGIRDSWIKGSGIIDKSLLKCGILRQCGFVMPPNYYGIDFVIPFVFYRNGDYQKPLYSFLAVQSKTSKENVSECAIKMAANLHLVRCPVHESVAACTNSCSARFYGEEIREICENQICLLLSAKNTTKRIESSFSICAKNYPINSPEIFDIPKFLELSSPLPKPEASTAPPPPHSQTQGLIASSTTQNVSVKLKLNTYYNQFHNYKNIISDAIDESDEQRKGKVTPYPGLTNVAESKKPDFISTKVFDNDFEVQRLVWDYEVTEPMIPATELESRAGTSTSAPKKLKLEDKIIKRQRVMTCIASHSIEAFSNVVNENTMAIILQIIAHEISNFHNVEPMQLPILQNSMLYGKFCPYSPCNPMLKKYRGLNEPGNPISNYQEIFTHDAWMRTVSNCIIGPVDAKVSEIPNNYHQIVAARIREEEQEPEPIDISFLDDDKAPEFV